MTIYPINVYQIVMYHFVFWMIFPATNIVKSGQYRTLGIYSTLTISTLVGFIGFSPLFADSWLFRSISYQHWFVALSFFHITLTFAISSANPAWIRSIFQSSDSKLPA